MITMQRIGVFINSAQLNASIQQDRSSAHSGKKLPMQL